MNYAMLKRTNFVVWLDLSRGSHTILIKFDAYQTVTVNDLPFKEFRACNPSNYHEIQIEKKTLNFR